MDNLYFSRLASVGLLLSLLGAIVIYGIKLVTFHPAFIYLTIITTLFLYQIYLIRQSKYKTGLFALTAIFWLCNLILLFYFELPYQSLATSLFLLWLTRCIYFHQRLIAMLLDAALILVGTASAYWVLFNSGSWFLSFWCFYLSQALLVFMPQFTRAGESFSQTDASLCPVQNHHVAGHSFEPAYTQAINALKKLSCHTKPGA